MVACTCTETEEVIDKMKALTRKLRACLSGYAIISAEFISQKNGDVIVEYRIDGEGLEEVLYFRSWPEVQQAVEWFVACVTE